MRPFVTQIDSNLKGGVSLTLSPRTLILGHNGAGKDAILNTVALALTGIADDVIGRDTVKDAALIVTLGDSSGVNVKARLSTGTLCEYEAVRAPDGTAKKPVHRNVYPDAYPLRAVRDALTASADKARAFLLAQVSGMITDDDVERALLPATHGTYAKAARNALGATPVDRLLSVHATAKKRATDATTQAEGVDQSIRRTADTLGAEPLAIDVEEARMRAEQARAALFDANGPDVRGLHATANAAVTAYQRAKQDAERLRADAGTDAATAGQRAGQMDALLQSARWHVHKGQHACALCASPVPQGPAAFEARIADIEHALSVWTQRASADADARSAENEAARLKGVAVAALDRFEAAGGWTALSSAQNADGLRATYEAAQADYTRVQSAASAWATVRTFRAQHTALLEEAADMRALRESTTNAIGNLLDRAADAFAARVQRYLPASDVFALRLRDGDREVCRFGFLRDGQLHAALSGAEWSRCLTAIAAAVAENANPDHPILLVPPERAFDPATLTAVLDAWKDAPGQVLIASPVAPTRVPDGWTVVSLDGAPALPQDDGATATEDKPKRKRRTKAEMEAARAAAAKPADVVEADAPVDAPVDADAVALAAGPWFDVSALTEDTLAPEIVAPTPTVARYAPDESADEVASFFARLRGVAEAK